MADDDWRHRKAQQLGLIDTRPLGAAGDGRRPAASAPFPPQKEWRTGAPATRAGARSKDSVLKAPADGPRRLAFAGGTALALFVAAGTGWLLNDAVGQRSMAEFPPPVVRAARPATPAIAAPAPIRAAAPIEAAASAPVPMPVEIAPPAAAPPAAATLPRPTVVMARRDTARPAAPRGNDIAVAAARRGGGPSFNCRRARTPDSRMICASPELSGLDRALVQSYRNAVRRAGPSAEYRLDRQQSAFLNARAACQSAPCIARLYYRRLERLDGG